MILQDTELLVNVSNQMSKLDEQLLFLSIKSLEITNFDQKTLIENMQQQLSEMRQTLIALNELK